MGHSTRMNRRHLIPILIAAVVVPASHAFAHTELVFTSPKSGSVVRNLPPTITLTFGEAGIRVVSVKVLCRGTLDRAVSAVRNPKNARQILVRTRRNDIGLYTVKWTITAADGDAVAGTYRFRVRR